MIDTHSHIYDEAFDDDFDLVVARAKEAGVERLVLPAIDKSTHERMLRCAQRLNGYGVLCAGLHPTSIDATWREEMNFLYDHIDDNPICAIGEIGLDEYWSREFIDEQMDIFAEQLLIAHERDLPVIIHSRESTEDIFKVLDRVGKELRGVFHAYSGSFETYQRVKRYGDFKIGIGGVVTYKNSNLPKVVERVPLCDILLETDAPWLTPVPHRGERNESSYVKYVAQKIALIKGVSEDEVRRVTTQNAKSLFNI